MTHIETEQSTEIPLTELTRGSFQLRFASYRKGEDAKLSLRSEDFIVSNIAREKASFTLCDGVGSSFYGNLGSQILAETLMTWLGKITPPNAAVIGRAESAQKWRDTLIKDLTTELNSKTKFATAIIHKKDLADKDELIRVAETTQRDDFGTQSNFACGVVWARSASLPGGLIVLLWLGNARLRLFNQIEELTAQLGWGKDPDQLREVWSSKDGVVGKVYCHVTDLSKANTVIAYSDGLENVEDSIRPDLSPAELENLILQSQAVKDDDATFLELTVGSTDIPGIQDDIVDMLRTVNTAPPYPASISDADTSKHRQSLDTLQKKYEAQRASADHQRRMLLLATGLVAALCFVGGLLASAVAAPILFKPTITATSTSTLTVTASPSQTPSSTPSLTETPTASATVTETATFTPTFTASSTAASASPEADTPSPTSAYTETPVPGTPKP
jgi:hypothetical protein